MVEQVALCEIAGRKVVEGSRFAITDPVVVSNGNMLQAINLENLSAGAKAVNEICCYEGEILAMHYAYDNAAGLNS